MPFIHLADTFSQWIAMDFMTKAYTNGVGALRASELPMGLLMKNIERGKPDSPLKLMKATRETWMETRSAWNISMYILEPAAVQYPLEFPCWFDACLSYRRYREPANVHFIACTILSFVRKIELTIPLFRNWYKSE